MGGRGFDSGSTRSGCGPTERAELFKVELGERVITSLVIPPLEFTVQCVPFNGRKSHCALKGSSTAGVLAIVHFGSVGRLWGLFERSKLKAT